MGGSSCILDPHEARAICKGNGVPCNFQHRACPRKWQGSILCTCFLIRAFFFIFSTDLPRAKRASAGGACAPQARGAERAPAARRRRNTPGGPPSAGRERARARQPPRRGEGRAGQGERSARRTGTRQDQEHRARQRGRPAIQNVDFVGHTCPTKSPPRFV